MAIVVIMAQAVLPGGDCGVSGAACLGLCGGEIVMASGGDVCACCGILWTN